MFAVEEFVAACRNAIDDTDPRGAVREVLREAVTAPSTVADVLRPERAGITLLHHSSDLTVIDVVWAPRMRIFAHDHRMWAAIAVYSGREDNEFFRRATTTTGLVPSNGRTIESGDVVVLGSDTVHAVHNPSSSPTGAIHVYGGDFLNHPRSQWRPPELIEEPYDPAAVADAFDDANRAWLGTPR